MKIQNYEIHAMMRCFYDNEEEIPGLLEVDHKHIVDKINKCEHAFDDLAIFHMDKDEPATFIPRCEMKYLLKDIAELMELHKDCFKKNPECEKKYITMYDELEKKIDRMIEEYVEIDIKYGHSEDSEGD